MKTAQKVFSLFFCLLYVPSLLYVPGRINTLFQDKNAFSQSAKAQDSLYIPRFKRTLKVYEGDGFTPIVPWVGGANAQDRFNGFDKIGELPTGNQQKRVIAVGYGRLWEYQNTLTGNDWKVKAWYVPEGCVNEDVGANTRVEFYRDHVFIFRTGVSCEGESAFNFLHLQVYKYVGNVLTQVYHDSNLFRFNGGGAQYSPSTAIVGDVQNGSDTLYFGFFRPGDDGNAADKAVLGMIKGFNSDGTPKIHKLCQGYNPNTGAKCNITASIHHLIGSGNGHLYAFQQLKVGNMIRNTLVYLEVKGVGTGQGLSYKLTDFKPINNVYFEVGFGDGNLNKGYFTVFDSIFSFGKLIFAVGLRKGNWPNCGSPETIRQIIVSFVPDPNNPTNIQINQFDVGSLVHVSSEVPTGRCNRGPGISENGHIFNGGGFVEINKDNTKKLLYGFTYCKVGPGSYGGLISCRDGTTGNALIQYLNDTNWTRINMLGSDRDFPGRYSDVRVISMYYSESYKKLFAGIRNRDRVFNTAAPPNIVHHPGLWVDDFTQLIPPPTPTPPPVGNSCTSLLFNGNSTVGSINPQNPDITIVNTGTAVYPDRVGYVDIIYNNNSVRKSANGQPVNNGQAGAYTMRVTFNLENDFRDLQDSGATSAQVRVAIPGTNSYANEPQCILNLQITPYQNPKVNGSVGGSCTISERLNPYKLTFTMNALPSNVPGARVDKVVVILIPSNINTSFNFDEYGNLRQSTSYVVVDSGSSRSSSGYQILNKSLIRSPIPPYPASFTFTVSFDPDNDDYYKNYIRTKNLKYQVFVRDTTGRNNQLSDPRRSGIIYINPLDDCASLYYKTGNGDVRSYEPRGVEGTTNFNRILRVNPNQGINNFNKFDDAKVSDYLYQGLQGFSTTMCNKLTRLSSVDGFCRDVNNNTQLQLNQLVQNLNNLMNNPGVETYKIDGGNTPNFAVRGYGQDYNTLYINVHNINNSAQKFVIVRIEGLPGNIQKVRVYDDINNNNTPNNVIVWCAVRYCKMEISPIAFNDNVSVSGNNQVSYVGGMNGRSLDNLKNYLLNKSRLYVNTGAGGPIMLYSDFNDSNKVHIYSGGIITNNYFYTNNSKKTNIIKGFVYTKGVVASGNALTILGESNSNRNIYFRDFYDRDNNQPKPILYIDFDPKYSFTYKDLFVRDSETVRRNIVGL